MRGLCDHIHALGLKAGIYSTPWTTSYAGFVAHISRWCLWGSPMIIGTPIERLDPFTLSLLSTSAGTARNPTRLTTDDTDKKHP